MKRASVLLFCLLFCLMATTAFAGGFALFEWGNRSVAMGTSTYATGNDASVLAYNPALMTQFDTTQILVGAAAIAPSTDVTITSAGASGSTGDFSTTDQTFMVPHAYLVHPYSDKVAFGVGVFTRFGLGTKYGSDWGGKTMLQEILLESFSFQPTAAFQVSDNLSIGVGAEIMKGSMVLKKAIPNAMGAGNSTIDVEGYSAGAVAAAHYRFDENWSLGFTYRSPVEFTGSGDFSTEDNNFIGDTDATVSATFPSSFALGLGYEDKGNWSIESSVVYTRWEEFDYMSFDFGNDALDSEEEFYYKNTWRLQLGGEYFVTESVALRAGYAYDQTPTRHDYSSPMLPSNDRHLLSTGLGYYGNGWNIDFSALYIIAKARHGVSKTVANDGTYEYDFTGGQTWVVGLSAGYAF